MHADTSLVDVIGQVARQEDGELIVYINSCGGEVEEGFAIYDYLRGLGRPIRTIASDMCASIATVVFLAGDVRIARGDLMIHNPWTNVSGNANELRATADIVEEAERRIERLYAERLGLDKQTISNLMNNERWLSPEEALSLGFATTSEIVAYKVVACFNNKNQNQMEEKKKTAEGLIDKLSKLLGLTTYNYTLVSKDGVEVTIDKEEGAPEVGDKATPDGVHEFEDGTKITVAEGVITEVVVGETENDELKRLKEENERLVIEIEELKKKLAEAEPVAEDKEILDVIKEIGGVESLKVICSTYAPKTREVVK